MKIYRKLNSNGRKLLEKAMRLVPTPSNQDIEKIAFLAPNTYSKSDIAEAKALLEKELAELDNAKTNERKPQFSELENAIADSDKAKLKELKAKLEKAADGTDEEFKKAQKAYDDFMDTVKSNKNNSLRIFRTVKNDLREEATRGHGFLTEKTARELQAKGTFIDYYTQSNGDKKYAKITKVGPSGYTVGGESPSSSLPTITKMPTLYRANAMTKWEVFWYNLDNGFRKSQIVSAESEEEAKKLIQKRGRVITAVKPK